MAHRALLRRSPAALRSCRTSSTVYGSTSISSGRGAFASLAGLRVIRPRRSASPSAVRTVRCAWFAVAGELPARSILA